MGMRWKNAPVLIMLPNETGVTDFPGYKDVLQYIVLEGTGDEVKKIRFWWKSGSKFEPHIHPHSDEVLTCEEGSFTVLFEDPELDQRISKGQTIIVPKNTVHAKICHRNSVVTAEWIPPLTPEP